MGHESAGLIVPFSPAASIPDALSVSIDAHVHRLVSDRFPDDMMLMMVM
jgi:hypothetical protein